jgi:hypothetical protein
MDGTEGSMMLAYRAGDMKKIVKECICPNNRGYTCSTCMDLRGTKMTVTVFSLDGEIVFRDSVLLNNEIGKSVGNLIASQV